MMDWIKNTGNRPDLEFVDVRLNVCRDDTSDYAEFHSQDPENWDWRRNIGGVEITHYRQSQPKG